VPFGLSLEPACPRNVAVLFMDLGEKPVAIVEEDMDFRAQFNLPANGGDPEESARRGNVDSKPPTTLLSFT
jgi:hypothetical protein